MSFSKLKKSYFQHFHVLKDDLLVLLLFFGRICVVESHDQLALKSKQNCHRHLLTSFNQIQDIK